MALVARGARVLARSLARLLSRVQTALCNDRFSTAGSPSFSLALACVTGKLTAVRAQTRPADAHEGALPHGARGDVPPSLMRYVRAGEGVGERELAYAQ